MTRWSRWKEWRVTFPWRLIEGPVTLAEGIVLTLTLGFVRPHWTSRVLENGLRKVARCRREGSQA